VQVKPSHGLTDEEVERMLLDSLEHAEDDVQRRQLADTRIEARRVLHAAETALRDDADLLSAEERSRLEVAATAVHTAVAEGTLDRLRATLADLEAASEELAKRRMDRALTRALSGRRAEEVG